MNIYAYINTETQEYPIFAGKLFTLFPTIDKTVENFDVPEGYQRVYNNSYEFTEVPTIKQKIVENSPVFDTELNAYKRSFSIVDLTEEELAAKLVSASETVRSERDVALLKSDALVTIDRWEAYDDTVKENLRVYRQALRDIPQQEGFPFDIVNPEEPII
jgi:hypothetical protein